MTTIVDYGMGNLGSIQNMLKKLGETSVITSDIDIIEDATRIILPGVGSFDAGMKRLHDLNLIDSLNKKVLEDKVPTLGICLGVQLMTESSMEGELMGLNWFEAKTIYFDHSSCIGKFVLPNMGWRKVTIENSAPLFNDFDEDSWFYFAHNYHLSTGKDEIVGMTSFYGYEYVAALIKGNILGVQFHPEKSHKYGLRLLGNFLKYY